MTLLGVSSPLHVWDPEKESFSFRGLSDNETGKLVVPPLDDVASQRQGYRVNLVFYSFTDTLLSLVHRFLTIGTLTRRLEVLILQLQAMCVGPNFSTTHKILIWLLYTARQAIESIYMH